MVANYRNASLPPVPPWGMPQAMPQAGPAKFDFATNPMITALSSSLLANRGAFGPAMASFGQMAPQAMALHKQAQEKAKQRAALNAYIRAKSGLMKPEDQALMAEYHELAEKFAMSQLTPGERKIIDDANSVPRYVDSGEPVFKNDASAPEGMFSGKSVSGQGLNWLVQNQQLTQAQAAQIAAGKMVTGADGSIYYMKPEDLVGASPSGALPPVASAAAASAIPGAPPSVAAPGAAANPPGQGGTRLTSPKTFGDDTETKAAGFASRMQNSNAIIDELEGAGTSFWDKQKGNVPVVGNYLISDEYRQLDQAKRDFVNAQLRRESGAVIADTEFENAEKQYFPQPGDDKKTIAQKKINRQLALKAMERSAGPLNQGIANPAPVVPPDTGAPPAGVAADEWKFMTPEERALFQ